MLNQTEVEVVKLLAAGHTEAGVARELGMRKRTVHHHLMMVHNKLDVNCRARLICAAYEQGILPAPDRTDT